MFAFSIRLQRLSFIFPGKFQSTQHPIKAHYYYQ